MVRTGKVVRKDMKQFKKEFKIATIEKVLKPFLEELLPGGGIDVKRSRWQKAGRGVGITPERPDIRYLSNLVEVLYRFGNLSVNPAYHALADSQVRFVARFTRKVDPSWLMGTSLECIGFYHRYNNPDEKLKKSAQRIVNWARKRKVAIRIGKLTYEHFPCGYGCMQAKDAGWTNDLSLLGSGLVWAYEVTDDNTILKEAASFAEYFVQPWQANVLGSDGYWHSGTWRDDMGSWLIGPLHYHGFESTDVFGDEASWVYSTRTCIDYLTHLYRYKSDTRFLKRCINAAQWTFKNCQFEDGAIGSCGRDDKWLGTTGCAISQVVALKRIIGNSSLLKPLILKARHSYLYLSKHLAEANIGENGIEWVNHKTLADPMVNVGWMWLYALLGYLDGEELE